jgi:transcriptional regulator GlxA family with amidase domain
VAHEVRMGGAVDMCTLYVQPQYARHIKPECHVIFVSDLLRELIVRCTQMPALYDEQGMEGRVMQLILDEVAASRAEPFGLRMPSDPRLLRLCEALLGDVSTRRPVAELAASAGLSERSVNRLFPRETGLSFHQWHNQAKVLKAFELFDKGQTVTQVALELGYSSPSAFAKMFRRLIGKAPAAMRASGSVT